MARKSKSPPEGRVEVAVTPIEFALLRDHGPPPHLGKALDRSKRKDLLDLTVGEAAEILNALEILAEAEKASTASDGAFRNLSAKFVVAFRKATSLEVAPGVSINSYDIARRAKLPDGSIDPAAMMRGILETVGPKLQAEDRAAFEKEMKLILGGGPAVPDLAVPVKVPAAQRKWLAACEQLPPEMREPFRGKVKDDLVLIPGNFLDSIASLIGENLSGGTLRKSAIPAWVALFEAVDEAVVHYADDGEGGEWQRPEADPRFALPADKVYQFRVTLKWTDPPIWRRFQCGDITLGEMHDIVQDVMGWEDCHLHGFKVAGKRYSPPSPEAMDWGDLDEDSVLLSNFIDPKSRKRPKFHYEYDFGDGWAHEIVYEGPKPREEGAEYPRCIDGALACPPEDCGGVHGYYDYISLEPGDPEYEERMEWLGEYDPEEFDLVEVNNRLWPAPKKKVKN